MRYSKDITHYQTFIGAEANIALNNTGPAIADIDLIRVQSGGLAASSLIQQVPGLAIASLPSFTPNRDLLVGVLKSRTIAQGVVDRFGLQARYRTQYVDDAIRALRGATTIAISREGVISVKVEDGDPAIAAAMANYHIELLDKLAAQYGTGEAGRQRTFLTGQLARSRVDLDAAEQALRRFQELQVTMA